jgi:flagellar hook-basal body complex protein FliE
LFGAARRGHDPNRPENGLHFPSLAAAWRPTVAAMDPIRSLKPFDFAQAVARAGLGVDGKPLVKPAAPEGDFASAMSQALKSVSAQQQEATRLQRELQLDNPTVSLEQTMVAMQKSQIGFQSALTVRNQLVRAYSDIMNMQV